MPMLGDQKRVMTPRAAIDAGASILVIGRPVTAADDPATALEGNRRDALGLDMVDSRRAEPTSRADISMRFR